MDPLVVTLVLDRGTQQRFEDERRRLFPPGRTDVGAHLTLFHAVPGLLLDRVLADLEDVAAIPAFDVAVAGVLALGRGAAYDVGSPQLRSLHRTLQRRWWDDLTAQDRQGLRAHVTVQNKVAAERARETVSALRTSFVPFSARAEALALWWYRGGPWEPVRTVPFRAAATR